MAFERRKQKRFSATAFLGRQVLLAPLPPYFGQPVVGRLVDLSAGGMSIFITEIIPPEVALHLTITFPDGSNIRTPVTIRYAFRKGQGFLHGIEFVALPEEMAVRLSRMSSDYIDCESRIGAGDRQPCRTDCAFFAMCRKKQKLDAVVETEQPVSLSFRSASEAA